MKPTPQCLKNLIRDGILAHPERTYKQLASDYGVCESTIKMVAKENGIRRPTGPGAPSWHLKPDSRMRRKSKAVR